MRKIVKLSLVLFAFFMMSFSVKAIISWQNDTLDVGDIPQGTPKAVEFTFKNKGDKSVIITNVRAGCGCTATEYSKEAIAPGKSGYVKAVYNAAGKGGFSKNFTVTTNAEETPKVLTLKGNVI